MIIRTYRCDECGIRFEVTLESGNDGDPDCPNCTRVLEWEPTRFVTTTNKSKAMDLTQKILETDYGLTNFKDNSREGDIAAIVPAPTRAQTEEQQRIADEVRQMAEQAHLPPAAPGAKTTWGAGNNSPLNNPMIMQTLLASGRASMADPNPHLRQPNPIDILHQGGRDGLLPSKFRIIGSWKPGQS